MSYLPTQPVAVVGVVRAELFCGARDPGHRAALEALLAPFIYLPTPETIWDIVGDNLATLRSKGITVPFPDVLIASLAIHHNVELWARDTHFSAMQAALTGLQLFHESP